jgi:hypothetical protein
MRALAPLLLLLSLVGVTACAKAKPQAAPPSAAVSAAPSPSPSVDVVEDGRHAAYIREVDAAGRAVTFDRIEFLTGEAAVKAWRKDNPTSTQPGPDNDYFIVNDNPKLRTMQIAPDAEIIIYDWDDAGGAQVRWPLEKLFKVISADPDWGRPMWLTVNSGLITRIDEQFIP